MQELLSAIILGIVQGVTEWLPVSSSGHLVVAEYLLGLKQPVVFDIILHLASLLVVLVVFRKDIISLAIGSVKLEKEKLRYLAFLALASLPIAFVGLFLNSYIKSAFQNIMAVAAFLAITGIFLFLTKFSKARKRKASFVEYMAIGLAQAFAILPGISRSGITLSVALMLGIKGKDAARFSFLLFIPAIVGAFILEAPDLSKITDFGLLAYSFLAAFLAGLLSLKLVLMLVKNNKLYYFSYYCFFLSILIFLFL